MCLLIKKIFFLRTYTASRIRCTKSKFVAGDKCLEMHVAMTNLPYPFPDINHVLGKMCCRKGSKGRAKSSALWDITCRATISLQKNKQLTLSFSRFIYPVYFFFFPSPHNIPFLYPHPYFTKEGSLNFLVFLSASDICIRILLHSKICLLHSSLSLTLLPKSTHFVLLLYISLPFLSCLLYISSLSLVVRNFPIHNLRILFLS